MMTRKLWPNTWVELTKSWDTIKKGAVGKIERGKPTVHKSSKELCYPVSFGKDQAGQTITKKLPGSILRHAGEYPNVSVNPDRPFANRTAEIGRLLNIAAKSKIAQSEYDRLIVLIKADYDDGYYGYPGSPSAETMIESEIEKLNADVKRNTPSIKKVQIDFYQKPNSNLRLAKAKAAALLLLQAQGLGFLKPMMVGLGSTPEASDRYHYWSHVPDENKVSIKVTQLKSGKLEPGTKLFTQTFQDFVKKDDGSVRSEYLAIVYAEKNVYVASDSHVLLFKPYKVPSQFVGKIWHWPTDQLKERDNKYLTWENVIPSRERFAKAKFQDVDFNKLLTIATVISDIINAVSMKYSPVIISIDGEYSAIDANYGIKIAKHYLQQGIDKGKMCFIKQSTYNQIIFTPKKPYEDGFILAMPIIIDYGEDPSTLMPENPLTRKPVEEDVLIGVKHIVFDGHFIKDPDGTHQVIVSSTIKPKMSENTASLIKAILKRNENHKLRVAQYAYVQKGEVKIMDKGLNIIKFQGTTLKDGVYQWIGNTLMQATHKGAPDIDEIKDPPSDVEELFTMDQSSFNRDIECMQASYAANNNSSVLTFGKDLPFVFESKGQTVRARSFVGKQLYTGYSFGQSNKDSMIVLNHELVKSLTKLKGDGRVTFSSNQIRIKNSKSKESITIIQNIGDFDKYDIANKVERFNSNFAEMIAGKGWIYNKLSYKSIADANKSIKKNNNVDLIEFRHDHAIGYNQDKQIGGKIPLSNKPTAVFGVDQLSHFMVLRSDPKDNEKILPKINRYGSDRDGYVRTAYYGGGNNNITMFIINDDQKESPKPKLKPTAPKPTPPNLRLAKAKAAALLLLQEQINS